MKLDVSRKKRRGMPVTMDVLNKIDKPRDLPLLRPAVPGDRRRVYSWLVDSDATRAIMGPPHFPEYPVPGWEKFCADYSEHFFLPEGDGYGRIFILCMEGRELGYIGYFGLNNWRGVAELEICIASSADWGQGWGSGAIGQLSKKLLAHSTVESVVSRPSRRSRRVIAAFRKAGFDLYDARSHRLPTWIFSVGLNYRDVVIMLKTGTPSSMND